MTRLQQLRWSAIFCFCAIALPVVAQPPMGSPREIVRRAIENESKEPANRQYFMFRDSKRTKKGDLETREMIDTPQLVLARLVAVNGQPLTGEQRTNEDARLNRLVNDPDELAKKRKEQQEDDQRVRKMVKAIPDAFLFEYQGTEPTPSGELIVLKFTPDPNWNPPSRELSVYTGMSGTMKIAVPQYRLALMQANLFKDVE